MDITAVFLLAFALLLAGSLIERKIDRTASRTARVERKLDLIIEHLGIDATSVVPNMDGVLALVREGKKVQAIKMYREATGVGLKEAKDEIDRLAADGR
ncbi:ribosomal protein L7/L12 [Streptomyces boluensis]|uniref:Large ribosomal subunit protein bL12 C-terminal domain-containing protein n=1 Tax=Streptomyces boluensis TaxID=1775135 RepID=A0A964XJ68_9ACTN|nr:ribosomal protein L7/L12 [Streptomyces boluensis]NBE50979.1 hypothetical protein [Streptomyces boluensis]